MRGPTKWNTAGTETEVNKFQLIVRSTVSFIKRLPKSRLLLAVAVPPMLAACGIAAVKTVTSSTPKRSASASHGSVLRTVPAAFAGVEWDKVPIPGKDLVSPGMLPTASCDMSPVRLWPSNKTVAFYLTGFGNRPLAVVPVECAAYNQSPISFLLYQGVLGRQPKLLEVLYEGNLFGRLLTNRVPTASVAAQKPHHWSGLFIWNGPGSRFGLNRKELSFAVSGSALSFGGLVVPVNGTLPYAGDSTRGYVFARYTYVWTGDLFRFVSSSAGVPLVVPS